jgi:exopolyphosphatase/pppGpp-phosphohydrolase
MAAAAGDAAGWRSTAEAALRAGGEGLLARLRAAGPAWRLVVTGGTVTSAAAVRLGLPSYEHSRVHMARLTGAQLLQLAGELSNAEAQAR